MLHPPLVHFAIVLPIIALIISIRYLYKPSLEMSKISSGYLVLASLFILGAYFTGKHDGSEAYPLLTSEGVHELIEHKTLGLYITIGITITALIKLFGTIKQNKKIEIFAIVLLAVLIVSIFLQGKMGGELTYEYGANIQNHSVGLECLEDAKEFSEDE